LQNVSYSVRSALLAAVFLAVACGSATPAPVAGSPLDQVQLKFAVLDAAGKPVFCDPDYYPVARGEGEQANAIARYPEIKADATTYAAILAHEHLTDGALTDAQKLTVYRAWKLLRATVLTQTGSQYSFQYRIQSSTGSAAYQMIAGTVSVDGRVTVTSRTPTGPPNCPICLAASTLIATPAGPVRVTDVRVGMTVWTQDAQGDRVAAPVVQVGSMPVPAGHLMVHLVLADGRELLVSPGHPAADGRHAGDLRAGKMLDGSVITSWELVPYGADRTYDLLPAGATGHYWANGILMASTLAQVSQ
jgi:hypothetical protein